MKTIENQEPKLLKGSDHIRLFPTNGMSREEWLDKRRRTVGGSEAGTILGLNPFQSAYALWNEKLGITAPFEGNLATECGTFMEEFVAKKFQSISGYAVRRTNYLWYNDRYEGSHASPDRLVHYKSDNSNRGIGHPVAGLECKTTSEFRLKKFRGVDFPEQYYAQCVHYMMVTELRVWYLAVLVGNREFHIFRLVRDDNDDMPAWCEGQLLITDEEINALYEAEAAFMVNLRNRIPPTVDGSDSSTEAVKVVNGDSTNDIVLDMQGCDALLRQYLCHKADAKAADDQAEAIANQIKLLMGDHSKGICGSITISYKTQQSGRMDTTRLLKDHPEMAIYKKAVSSRPFKVVEA